MRIKLILIVVAFLILLVLWIILTEKREKKRVIEAIKEREKHLYVKSEYCACERPLLFESHGYQWCEGCGMELKIP